MHLSDSFPDPTDSSSGFPHGAYLALPENRSINKCSLCDLFTDGFLLHEKVYFHVFKCGVTQELVGMILISTDYISKSDAFLTEFLECPDPWAHQS